MAASGSCRTPRQLRTGLVTRLRTTRHPRRETTGWISKCNRVCPGRADNLKFGRVTTDCHDMGSAIDRDGDLLARVARIGERKLGLQFVVGDAAHIERNQVSAWDAS